jgi:acyl-coenzyme A synthetase/AMP-(fatty) acid ligase
MEGRRASACDSAFVGAIVFLSFVAYVGELGFYSDDWDGEIEVGLLKHPDVREAAVVAVPDSESGVRIAAFVSCHADRTVSVVALRSFSVRNLPGYLVPDTYSVLDALPRTPTDKTDYQILIARAKS